METKHLIPLGVFLLIAVALGVGLTLKPKEIPSAMIDQPVRAFDLPALENRTKNPGRGLALADISAGQVTLVNFFATWCGPCRVEHPLWMDVARQGEVPIHAINYKDIAENAATWLRELGDPYDRVGVDLKGRTGFDWGVYGMPETFVIDGQGRIKLKHIGPISRDILDQRILPCVNSLKADAQATC